MESQQQNRIHSPANCKSKVWQHYGFYKRDGKLDKSNAICKLCNAAIKYTGSTTNLIAHVKRRHSINIEAEACSESVSLHPGGSSRGEPNISAFFSGPLASNSNRAKAVTDAISYFICKALLPYSVTENEGFQYMLRVLEPRFKIPCRKIFTEKEIPALYEKVKREIYESLHRAQRVALTVDGWTSCATDSYITVTVHYVDEAWAFQNHVLQTRVFNESHTGINLAALLRDVCQEWSLEDKNPALVSDNARNMLLAGAEAELDPHVRCIAHTLNLASQKAFKVEEVSQILVKMRKLVTFFHKSPKATEVLRETQTQLHLPNHKLVHDVSTRWNSSLDMLERFWEQQPAVLNALLSKKLKRGEALVTLTEGDMTLIPEIIKLMKPLKVATVLLSEEKNPTLSMITPIQAKLKMHFQPDENDLPIITQMKEQFTKDFSARYTYLQDLLNSASALDPRFKDLAFLDDSDTTKDMVFMKITTEAVKMSDVDLAVVEEVAAENVSAEDEDDNWSPRSEADTDHSPPKKKTALDQMFGDMQGQRVQKKTIQDRAKEEILKYRERDTLSLDGNVLQWWKQQIDLPLLSVLAKSYLSIPATSVPCERVFSTAGEIINAKRSLLHPDHVDQLIFLKTNLKQEHVV